MENTPDLYETLTQVLRPHRPWWDLRPLKTLAWMMGGLIHSGAMSLGAWTPFVISRAQYSQSTVRRFRRWREHAKMEVHARYGRLIQHALVGWVDKPLSVACDPSLLWATSCTGRLSVLYRGRAVSLVWSVIAHGRATGAYEGYKALLDRAVAYPVAADNVSRPLSTRLRRAYQPVISTRNLFATPRPRLLPSI